MRERIGERATCPGRISRREAARLLLLVLALWGSTTGESRVAALPVRGAELHNRHVVSLSSSMCG